MLLLTCFPKYLLYNTVDVLGLSVNEDFCKQKSLYVPSCLYQMFDTSVEDHGDCCFKPSSSMKFNFYLLRDMLENPMGARLLHPSNIPWIMLHCCSSSYVPSSSLYLENTRYKIIALFTSFHCFLWTFLLGLFLDFFWFLCCSTTFEFCLSKKLWTTNPIVHSPHH